MAVLLPQQLIWTVLNASLRAIDILEEHDGRVCRHGRAGILFVKIHLNMESRVFTLFVHNMMAFKWPSLQSGNKLIQRAKINQYSRSFRSGMRWFGLIRWHLYVDLQACVFCVRVCV